MGHPGGGWVRDTMHVRGEILGNSVLPAQFWCESKTALKIES